MSIFPPDPNKVGAACSSIGITAQVLNSSTEINVDPEKVTKGIIAELDLFYQREREYPNADLANWMRKIIGHERCNGKLDKTLAKTAFQIRQQVSKKRSSET